MRKRLPDRLEEQFNRALESKETDPEQSVEILQEIDRQHPNHAAVVGMIAAIYFTFLKRYDQALRYSIQAVALSPRSEMASITLFHIYINLGENDKAFGEARRYVSQNGVTAEYEFLFTEMDNAGVFD